MRKANDDIPEDEMLLAEAIAAAKAHGMRWTRGELFRAGTSIPVDHRSATECCAAGALVLSGKMAIGDARHLESTGLQEEIALSGIMYGNDDTADRWINAPYDNGASLGFAFRCAMTQDEP